MARPEKQYGVDKHGFPTQATVINYVSTASTQYFINKYDEDISNLKVALSKYDHHFAIKLTFNCENHDLKICKVSKSEQLPILQIVHLIFMIGLK